VGSFIPVLLLAASVVVVETADNTSIVVAVDV
jgi:hypothetical protein